MKRRGSKAKKTLNPLHPGHLPWLEVRRRMFLHAREEVRQLLGQSDMALRRYEKSYANELETKKRYQALKKRAFMAQLKTKDLVLLGDFHALSQSQRSHLRILKELSQDSRPVVLALECVKIKDQKYVDAFLQGRISEEVFLAKIQWERDWGFPWEHYAPLFYWAKKKGIPILAINVGPKKKISLKNRDQFAAQILADFIGSKPDFAHGKARNKNFRQSHRIIVVIGDLHLAEKHLPASLKANARTKKLKLARVFQNIEERYFELLKQGLENKVDVVSFNKNDFCIFSVPPWIKWQSYLLFLEKHFDSNMSDMSDLEFSDHIAKLVDFLAKELGVKVHLGRISAYTGADTSFFVKLEQNLSVEDCQYLKVLLAMERSFVVPQMEAAYLGRLSVNHAASVAAEFLHLYLSKRQSLAFRPQQDFLRQIWLQAMIYFGSKIINHKRKTDSLDDIKRSLAAFDHSSDRGKEALLIVLQQKIAEMAYLNSHRSSPPRLVFRHKSSYWEAARLLGGMMGERLYNSYRMGQVQAALIVKLMSQPIENKNFDAFYYEMVELVESLPPFVSKAERL